MLEAALDVSAKPLAKLLETYLERFRSGWLRDTVRGVVGMGLLVLVLRQH